MPSKANWFDFDGNVKVGGDRLRPGKNVLVLEKQGNGEPVYATYFRRFREAETFTASKGGLTIEREYHLVRPPTGANKKEELVPLASGATVKSGDEIQVTLTVRADQPYGLRVSVTGLREEPDAPDHSKEVLIGHGYKVYDLASFTATGEEVPGDPQHSYANILRMGFEEGYIRENFAPPRS